MEKVPHIRRGRLVNFRSRFVVVVLDHNFHLLGIVVVVSVPIAGIFGFRGIKEMEHSFAVSIGFSFQQVHNFGQEGDEEGLGRVEVLLGIGASSIFFLENGMPFEFQLASSVGHVPPQA